MNQVLGKTTKTLNTVTRDGDLCFQLTSLFYCAEKLVIQTTKMQEMSVYTQTIEGNNVTSITYVHMYKKHVFIKVVFINKFVSSEHDSNNRN